jgi:hypothetical protein
MYYEQTNPEGRARLTRRLIVGLIRIVITKLSIARSSSEIYDRMKNHTMKK